MNLPFKTDWPDFMPADLAGQPNHFVEKIFKSFMMDHVPETSTDMVYPYWLENQSKVPDFSQMITLGIQAKYHTLREDKNDNWQKDNLIHFWMNFRTKGQYQFAPVVKCTGVQKVVISHFSDIIELQIDNGTALTAVKNPKGEIYEYDYQLQQIAINDGFPDVKSFFAWFNKDFTGKIIHWTNLKY